MSEFYNVTINNTNPASGKCHGAGLYEKGANVKLIAYPCSDDYVAEWHFGKDALDGGEAEAIGNIVFISDIGEDVYIDLKFIPADGFDIHIDYK